MDTGKWGICVRHGSPGMSCGHGLSEQDRHVTARKTVRMDMIAESYNKNLFSFSGKLELARRSSSSDTLWCGCPF